jgi:hypothetical protein
MLLPLIQWLKFFDPKVIFVILFILKNKKTNTPLPLLGFFYYRGILIFLLFINILNR